MEFHVKVSNKGSMTDVGEVKLYANGTLASSHRFEAAPGQTKKVAFTLKLKAPGEVKLSAVGKYSVAEKSLIVK